MAKTRWANTFTCKLEESLTDYVFISPEGDSIVDTFSKKEYAYKDVHSIVCRTLIRIGEERNLFVRLIDDTAISKKRKGVGDGKA